MIRYANKMIQDVEGSIPSTWEVEVATSHFAHETMTSKLLLMLQIHTYINCTHE